MNYFNQKGNIILFAVVAITAISVLGTGIYFMTTTATFSGLGANQQNRAYQLAVAGRDYALAKNLPNTGGRKFTLANGDKFNLVISGDTITSTGIVGEGTPYEARRTITVTKTGFGSQADIGKKDIGSYNPEQTAQTGYVSVDQMAAQISLGQLQASKFGSVWYGGNVAAGNCQNGACDFGTGFRTYFTFKLTRQESDIPHGFTFAFFNGTDNSSSSAGGDIGMPELLAYGGNSCTTGTGIGCTSWLVSESYRGINPPKIGIEFDGRRNAGGVTGICPPAGGNSDSREDGVRTHMANVFWGDNTSGCTNRGNSLTYDDNRHDWPIDPTYPTRNNAVPSPETSDTTDYFVGWTPFGAGEPNWLFVTPKVYAVRIEVTRALTLDTNTPAGYFYTINTWIKRCDSENISDPTACSEFAGFSNTKTAYDPVANPPLLNRTIKLDQTYHSKFNKFLFGFTGASGSASRQNVALSPPLLYFVGK
jgi:hypothetical protein